MFNQKRNLKYPSLFLICFFISTALFLNSCGRFILKDEGAEKISIEELSGVSSARTNIDGLNTVIYEITQTVGSDGLLAGFFVVPSNGISFLLSIFKDDNVSIWFDSLNDPDGIDILSPSSTPNLYNDATGSVGEKGLSKAGYSNVLVPQSPSFSAKAGTWTFKAHTNDRVNLALRTGLSLIHI